MMLEMTARDEGAIYREPDRTQCFISSLDLFVRIHRAVNTLDLTNRHAYMEFIVN